MRRRPPGAKTDFPRSPLLAGIAPAIADSVKASYQNRWSAPLSAAGIALHQAAGDQRPAIDQHEEDQLERQ